MMPDAESFAETIDVVLEFIDLAGERDDVPCMICGVASRGPVDRSRVVASRVDPDEGSAWGIGRTFSVRFNTRARGSLRRLSGVLAVPAGFVPVTVFRILRPIA